MNKDKNSFNYRVAELEDLNALLHIEKSCFESDALNKRSFRRWIQAEHGILLLVENTDGIVGYGLVWCHKGTRLARLYSLAVLPGLRGQGL